MANCYGSHPGEVPSSSNLIVNYLPQRLTDQEFHDLFADIGPIKTCKIVRNKHSGYSYGFGFVDYHNPEDAQKAIAAYNGYKMTNKTLKVAIAKPSDSVHSKNTNVYIRGVPRDFDPEELKGIFGQYGRLVQFRVLRDDQAKVNKGVAFALYDDRANADRAIQDMDGKNLPGGVETLQVKIADDQMKLKKHRAMTSFDPQARAGGPMHSRLPYGNNFRPNHRFNPMNKPGGFQMSQGPFGHNNQAYGDQAGTGSILFVYNIGLETDDSSLYHLFSQYGVVDKACVIKDKMTQKSKGYGFVTMHNYNEACWAIEQLNGFHYAGKPLQVSFKTAGKSNGMPGAMGQGSHMSVDHTGYDNGNGAFGTGYQDTMGYGQQQDGYPKRPQQQAFY